jgi:hypothetical protein
MMIYPQLPAHEWNGVKLAHEREAGARKIAAGSTCGAAPCLLTGFLLTLNLFKP